ncbi:hypothetical protein IFM89_032113 [Coptis chinensis]|uniref:Cytochrome P450 n=1 Tax=Coptis chinensis TaxID=261450 RepID=A0A835IT28_9MAGN|nr:hypothetical protein IFM89_032113 [Coptis chinensis]
MYPQLHQWLPTSIIAPAPIVFSFIVIVLICIVKKRSGNVSKTRKAPEVSGAWPLVGHLNLVSGPKLVHFVLGELTDKYGPAFTIHLGVYPTFVVSNWELVKECFTTNDKIFSNRPVNKAIKYMFYNEESIGFTPYGSYWRELRKMTTLKLLSNHRLDMLKPLRISEMDACFRNLYELWTKNKDDNVWVLVDMSKWFGEISFNVVARIVAGKKNFGSKGDRYKKVMEEVVRLMCVTALSDIVPYLGWLDRLRGLDRAMKRAAKELDSVLQSWVEEHRQRRVSVSAGTGSTANKTKEEVEKDFIDITLSIMEENQLPGDDPDTVIKSLILDMILGGSDTSTVTLTWTLSLLLNNVHALKKAQRELDAQIGKERQVEDSDIKNLPYIQAIIKEAMRLYPAGPIIEREASEDCDVGGFHVPAGTRLMVNLWKLQRDPNVWPNDPLEFRPERFLTSHADVDLRGQHLELIPFGSGRRVCPGISFSLQVMHLALARIIHGFELKIPNDSTIDMSGTPGIISCKATPLQTNFKKVIVASDSMHAVQSINKIADPPWETNRLADHLASLGGCLDENIVYFVPQIAAPPWETNRLADHLASLGGCLDENIVYFVPLINLESAIIAKEEVANRLYTRLS